MEHPVTFAICGCGNRGLEAYASYQKLHPERMRIVAGADGRPERLAMLRERYGVAEDMCFASAEELLARPRLADVLIVATQDRQHVPTPWRRWSGATTCWWKSLSPPAWRSASGSGTRPTRRAGRW